MRAQPVARLRIPGLYAGSVRALADAVASVLPLTASVASPGAQVASPSRLAEAGDAPYVPSAACGASGVPDAAVAHGRGSRTHEVAPPTVHFALSAAELGMAPIVDAQALRSTRDAVADGRARRVEPGADGHEQRAESAGLALAALDVGGAARVVAEAEWPEVVGYGQQRAADGRAWGAGRPWPRAHGRLLRHRGRSRRSRICRWPLRAARACF